MQSVFPSGSKTIAGTRFRLKPPISKGTAVFNGGGGIYNNGGTVTISKSTFSSNIGIPPERIAEAEAVLSGAPIAVST